MKIIKYLRKYYIVIVFNANIHYDIRYKMLYLFKKLANKILLQSTHNFFDFQVVLQDLIIIKMNLHIKNCSRDIQKIFIMIYFFYFFEALYSLIKSSIYGDYNACFLLSFNHYITQMMTR